MSLIKRIDDFAKAVGKEIRETNKRVEELAVRVLINLRNETPFVIGGHQLILLDSELKPHSITNSQNPYKERERYRGGFDLNHIYFYGGDNVKPFAGFRRKELYSRHPKIDFKLSSNCGDFLEPNKPVYLVVGYDEETNAYYLATKWWSQELPTKEDGLIYKHIGFARLNSFIQFFNDGKTYQFKGNSVMAGDSSGNIVGIVDETVIEDSKNLVTSGAVAEAVKPVQEKTEELHVKTEEIKQQTEEHKEQLVEIQNTTEELVTKTEVIQETTQMVVEALTDFEASNYLSIFNETLNGNNENDEDSEDVQKS